MRRQKLKLDPVSVADSFIGEKFLGDRRNDWVGASTSYSILMITCKDFPRFPATPENKRDHGVTVELGNFPIRKLFLLFTQSKYIFLHQPQPFCWKRETFKIEGEGMWHLLGYSMSNNQLGRYRKNILGNPIVDNFSWHKFWNFRLKYQMNWILDFRCSITSLVWV